MENTTPNQMRARLTTPVSMVSLLLLIIATGAAWYIDRIQRSVSELLNNNVSSLRAAQELEVRIKETRTHLNRYLMTGDRKYLEAIPELKQRNDESLAAVEAVADTPTERQLFQRIQQGYRHFFKEYDKLMNQAATQGMLQRLIELDDNVMVKEIVEPAREYSRVNETALNQSLVENAKLTDRLSIALLGLGLCGAFGGVLGGWVMASTIRRSILHTEEQLLTTAVKLQEAIPAQTLRPTPVRRGSQNPIEEVTRSASAVLSRLKRTEQEALRAEQLAWVGQMAAGIAHEVRNPLMTIKLLVQTIAESSAAEGIQPKQMHVLEEEIVRLEQIISTFLDYARPPRLERKLVEIGPLVGQVVDSVRNRADLQKVAIELQVPTQPIVAEIDGNQLRQVIYNLLFNALDAQASGGHLIVRIKADHGKALVLEVEDDGVGLPQQLGETIFEPFVSTKPSGLGLGLSICRRIVEGHGGTLRAASRDKGGSIFTLRVPLSPAKTHRNEPAIVSGDVR